MEKKEKNLVQTVVVEAMRRGFLVEALACRLAGLLVDPGRRLLDSVWLVLGCYGS